MLLTTFQIHAIPVRAADATTHIMLSNTDFGIIAAVVRLAQGQADVIAAVAIINRLINGRVSQADTLIFL